MSWLRPPAWLSTVCRQCRCGLAAEFGRCSGGLAGSDADTSTHSGAEIRSLCAVDAEDEKLVTLARSARARTGGAEGAAVRDEIGRTYVAATVSLPALSLTALQAAIAAAASSGASALEAAVVVTADIDVDRDALEGLGDPAVHVVAP
jgi:hypothetical protein